MSNELTASDQHKTASIYDLPPEMDEALRDLYAEFSRASQWDGRHLSLERLPTKPEREVLLARYRALAPAVKPISEATSARQLAGAEVHDMFKAWPAFKPESKEQSIGAYVVAMSDLPLFAIKEACLDITQGKIDKLSTFAPPPAPFIYQLAASKAKRILDQHMVLRRILSTKNIRVEHHTTPEEKERIGKGLQQVADNLRATQQAAETERQQELSAKKIQRDKEMILREYHARGMNPVVVGGLGVLSPSLLKNIEEYQKRPKATGRGDYKDLGS